MNNFDEIEEKGIKKTQKKKAKMKVSGKSVFLLQQKAGEEKEEKDKN